MTRASRSDMRCRWFGVGVVAVLITSCAENRPLCDGCVAVHGVSAITNMTLDREGRIVATVYGLPVTIFERAVVRMDRFGVLDPGFGERGLASTRSYQSLVEPTAIVVQQNGAIRIGGVPEAEHLPAVFGFTEDGHDDGLRIIGSGLFRQPVQYLMDQHGALVASYARTKGYDGVLARYAEDGTLDASFQPVTVERAVAITTDGAFVTAGRSFDDDPLRFLARRVTPDGQPDASFGGGAVVIPDVERDIDGEIRIAARSSGGLVMVGVSVDETPKVFVARFDGTGTLDASFGGRGYVTHDLGNATIVAVAELADGSVILVGTTQAPGPRSSRALIARLAPHGSLDPSFGDSGRVVLDIESRFTSVVVMPDGDVIAGGYSTEGALLVTFPAR